MLNKKYYKPVVLNWFDNYDILKMVENKRINTIVKQINNHTAMLVNKTDTNNYYIIHRCTKAGLTGQIQCTFFKGELPISDIVRPSYRELIQELCWKEYNVVEVI